MNYHTYKLSYKELLVLTNELPIHIRNIQTMMKEVYKAINGLPPPIMQDIIIIILYFKIFRRRMRSTKCLIDPWKIFLSVETFSELK